MKITWIGHSCFKVESNGKSVVFDPYQPGSVPGLSDVKESADLALCSHGHGDHNAAECVTLTGKGQQDIKVTRIDTFHDHHSGTKRGANIIHIVEMDGKKVAHMGDIGCKITPEQMAFLTDLDVLLIPVGGFFTIDAEEAAEYVKELQPKLTIPMHYQDPARKIGYPVIAPLQNFKEAIGCCKQLEASSVSAEEIAEQTVLALVPAAWEGEKER